jgi:hypothetical protein
MPQNINALREILFRQLKRLEEAGEYDIDMEFKKAEAIVHVSDNIIRSAQVENEFIRLTQSKGSGFIPATEKNEEIGPNPANISIKGVPLFDADENKNWLVNENAHKNINNE